jgi:hypothetical protein
MTRNGRSGDLSGTSAGRDEMELRALLQEALPPVTGERHRDLWPQMLDRLGERAPRVPWIDWVLVAGVVACVLFFPGLIPVLLYHL